MREPLVRDVDLRSGIAQDVRDLRSDEVPVDRGDVVTTLERGETQGNLLNRIRQGGGDVIALLQADRGQAVRDLVDEFVKLAVADLVVVGIGDRQPVGGFLGDGIEAEGVAHSAAPDTRGGRTQRFPPPGVLESALSAGSLRISQGSRQH